MLHYIILLMITGLVESRVNISEIMTEQKIVPDILHGPPREILQVTFANGDLNPGATLTTRQCVKRPKLNWSYEKNANYTLMMIGVTPWNQDTHIRRPYLPHIALVEATIEPPKIRKSLHWLVVNIPGNDLKKGQIRQVYHPFIHALETTNPERFILLIFKQKLDCNFDQPHPKLLRIKNTTDSNRIYINTVTYLLDYFFENENPQAGNYFDREINAKEDSQFNSADYEMMKNLPRVSKSETSKSPQDEAGEKVTFITLNPIV